MSTGDGQRLRRNLVTAAFLLGWGGAVLLDPQRVEPWPFTTFPMFRAARAWGEPVARLEIVGQDEGGQTVAALRLPGWRRQLLDALRDHPPLREELLRRVGERLNQARAEAGEPRLVGLRVVHEEMEVLPAPRVLSRRVLAEVRL